MGRYLLGQTLLAVSLAAAGLLVAEHLAGLSLPGCGPLSACAQLSHSRWGAILGWPVSFLGAAWFATLSVLHAWIGRRGGMPVLLRWGVRLGAAGSLLFLGVMVVHHRFCPYCLLVHAGNLAYWLLVETARRRPAASFLRPALAGGAVFAAVSLVLGISQAVVAQTAEGRAEMEFQESLKNIVAEVARQNDAPAVENPSAAQPLHGRWRYGPECAAIRLVVFGDYQCPSCRKIEAAFETAAAGRVDISLVFKHYPICRECNRQIKTGNMHEHACRAAAVAEAAGILGGNACWLRMHRWLFARAGQFSDAELRRALSELGIGDANEFCGLIDQGKALVPVKQDIEDAIALGIDTTPVVFLNGVELAHAEIDGGVQRAIDAVSAVHPQRRDEAADRPRPGRERLTAVWLAGRQFDLSGHSGRWELGPHNAPHRLVLCLCYQNEYSPRFSRAARELVGRRSDVRLEFWHFPLSKEHNPASVQTKKGEYAQSYQMALLAEAAGQLGGADAFWKVHEWLLAHQENFTVDAARDAATACGLDPWKLATEVETPAVRKAVDEDIAAAGEAGVQWAPSIFLGERLVPGPEPTAELMEDILQQMDRLSAP